MPKYRVLRPIEHGRGPASTKLYLPKGTAAPETVLSAGNGQEIPVDSSGVLDLGEKEAEGLLEDGALGRPEAPAEAGAKAKN